jgi:hypothetical protein
MTSEAGSPSPLSGQIPLPFTLTYQVEDLFENGLLNILRALPVNFPEAKRLEIESVVFTAHRLFRTYKRLEHVLLSRTTIRGELQSDASETIDIFSDVWSIIDHSYILQKLSESKYHRDLLKFGVETQRLLNIASDFRNFSDHIGQNFSNAVNAKGWFPLFGWLTYQFTPCAIDFSEPHNVLYLVNVSSTHLRSTHTISAPKHVRASAAGAIDRISLHLRSGEFCNISDMLIKLAIDLNLYSIGIHTYVYDFISRPENQIHGVQVPFAKLTVRADLHEQSVELHEIKSQLDENKMRFELTFGES